MPTSTDEEHAVTAADQDQVEGAGRRRPPRWFLSLAHVPLAFLWGLFFWVLNNTSLPSGDLWGHVLYGSWILDHRALPFEDPVMPLAAGIELVDDTWLSQVILAAVERAGGFEWLSHTFALLVLTTYVLLARACTLASGSKWVGTAGTLAALYLAWNRSTTFRAETFGALCFAVLLWLIVSSGGFGDDRRLRRWRLWLGIPVLFVLWANLHPSFVYGLAVLGCSFLGRAVDIARQSSSVGRVLADRGLRRRLLVAELAAAATLLNPYGIDLLLHVMGWTPQGVPRGPQGWQLAIQGEAGVALVLSWLLFTALFFTVDRKTPAAHVLLLIFFAAGAASAVRMLTWYAPVFALVSMPLWAAWWNRLRVWRGGLGADAGAAGCAGPSLIHTMVCVLVLWLALTLSPLGLGLVTGFSRSTGQLLHPSTPMAVTGYLRANPPQGQIFNPQAWGDWLAFEGPPGLALFITSRVGQVPHPVWRSYQRLQQAGYEWERVLRRFRIDTVVVDAASQRLLARAIRFTDGWSLAYDDGRAQVFIRDAVAGSDAEAGDNAEEEGHE